MKYRKYISTAFVAAMLLPLLSAKATTVTKAEDFDLRTVEFIENEQEINLGFDTAKYLPEGFDAYQDNVTVGSINFIEEEDVDLGFDTADYLS